MLSRFLVLSTVEIAYLSRSLKFIPLDGSEDDPVKRTSILGVLSVITSGKGAGSIGDEEGTTVAEGVTSGSTGSSSDATPRPSNPLRQAAAIFGVQDGGWSPPFLAALGGLASRVFSMSSMVLAKLEASFASA
jgi:hypothetical protein